MIEVDRLGLTCHHVDDPAFGLALAGQKLNPVAAYRQGGETETAVRTDWHLTYKSGVESGDSGRLTLYRRGQTVDIACGALGEKMAACTEQSDDGGGYRRAMDYPCARMSDLPLHLLLPPLQDVQRHSRPLQVVRQDDSADSREQGNPLDC
ncbi:hypothetical protein [Frateuria aurantia]|uniref:hypothetical protein n=1 Tax=Frateuria aurantia TaxID=81475 RepID=UPI001FE1FE0B|nr:hypothetical protein [Frateuria aurantia]